MRSFYTFLVILGLALLVAAGGGESSAQSQVTWEEESPGTSRKLSFGFGAGLRTDDEAYIDHSLSFSGKVLFPWKESFRPLVSLRYVRTSLKSGDDEGTDLGIEGGLRLLEASKAAGVFAEAGPGFYRLGHDGGWYSLTENRLGLFISFGMFVRVAPQLALEITLHHVFNAVVEKNIYVMAPLPEGSVFEPREEFSENFYNPTTLELSFRLDY